MGLNQRDIEAIDRGFTFLPFVFAVLGFPAMHLVPCIPEIGAKLHRAGNAAASRLVTCTPNTRGKVRRNPRPRCRGRDLPINPK